MSMTLPGPVGAKCFWSVLVIMPNSDCAAMLLLSSCSSLVNWGFEFDFFKIPLEGAGAAKLGFLKGLFILDVSLEDS